MPTKLSFPTKIDKDANKTFIETNISFLASETF